MRPHQKFSCSPNAGRIGSSNLCWAARTDARPYLHCLSRRCHRAHNAALVLSATGYGPRHCASSCWRRRRVGGEGPSSGERQATRGSNTLVRDWTLKVGRPVGTRTNQISSRPPFRRLRPTRTVLPVSSTHVSFGVAFSLTHSTTSCHCGRVTLRATIRCVDEAQAVTKSATPTNNGLQRLILCIVCSPVIRDTVAVVARRS